MNDPTKHRKLRSLAERGRDKLVKALRTRDGPDASEEPKTEYPSTDNMTEQPNGIPLTDSDAKQILWKLHMHDQLPSKAEESLRAVSTKFDGMTREALSADFFKRSYQSRTGVILGLVDEAVYRGRALSDSVPITNESSQGDGPWRRRYPTDRSYPLQLSEDLQAYAKDIQKCAGLRSWTPRTGHAASQAAIDGGSSNWQNNDDYDPSNLLDDMSMPDDVRKLLSTYLELSDRLKSLANFRQTGIVRSEEA